MRFNLLDYHIKMDLDRVLLYYKGPFEDFILANIRDYLRDQFEHAPKSGRRLFSIFMELAQNISFYSAETNYFEGKKAQPRRGIGTVVVYEDDDLITLTSGNLVDRETAKKVMKRCDEINQKDYETLREMKRVARNQPRTGISKGGNIGLIQVALKAQRPIKAECHDADGHYVFFVLSVNIEKEEGERKKIEQPASTT